MSQPILNCAAARRETGVESANQNVNLPVVDSTLTDPLIGRLLDGRYQIEEQIARGGMATVYRAVDTRLDRQIALKIMQPSFADDPEFVRRFIREAQAAAKLSDPHIVPVFDQGDDHGVLFLAMEYIPGRTLRELLAIRGRLTPNETVNIMTPVTQALAAAHRSGLVHRDVKPENVLIGDDGRVRVADFGLARAANASSTQQATRGILIGTVAYLAPEQVSPGTSDERSDVYAAGVLMFELLTGSPPFDAEEPMAVAYKHLHEDVPAPSSVVPGIPAALDAVVRAATQRDPAKRPANAAAFLELLRGLPPMTAPGADSHPTVIVKLDPDHPATTRATAVAVATMPSDPASDQLDGEIERAIKPRSRARGVIAILLVLGLAVGAGVFAWWLGNGRSIDVPGVAGLTANQAEAKLSAAGLAFAYGPAQFSEVVKQGEVISTDPAAGDSIATDGTVTMTLSKGPERFDVPQLSGMTADKAKQTLRDNHLAVGATEHKYSETVNEGLVISSSPATGKPLRADTAVDLVVSKGPPPIAVPNVVGASVDDAQSSIEGAGLKFVVKNQVYSKTVAKGLVISQNPSDTATLFAGGTVSVVESLGPPPVTVPNVVDSPVDQAIATLEAAGFHVSTYDIVGVSPLNRVATQNPDGGSQAPWGSTIRLGII